MRNLVDEQGLLRSRLTGACQRRLPSALWRLLVLEVCALRACGTRVLRDVWMCVLSPVTPVARHGHMHRGVIGRGVFRGLPGGRAASGRGAFWHRYLPAGSAALYGRVSEAATRQKARILHTWATGARSLNAPALLHFRGNVRP
jgi:hypothetical protein